MSKTLGPRPRWGQGETGSLFLVSPDLSPGGWPSSLVGWGVLTSEQSDPGEALDLLVGRNRQRAFPGFRDVGAKAAPHPGLGAEAASTGRLTCAADGPPRASDPHSPRMRPLSLPLICCGQYFYSWEEVLPSSSLFHQRRNRPRKV